METCGRDVYEMRIVARGQRRRGGGWRRGDAVDVKKGGLAEREGGRFLR